MYGIAAQASMTGNHTPMRAWLLDNFEPYSSFCVWRLQRSPTTPASHTEMFEIIELGRTAERLGPAHRGGCTCSAKLPSVIE